MKKRFLIIALCTLGALFISARAGATSFSAAKQLCSSWGGTWSGYNECHGSSLDGKKTECENSKGSYNKSSNNGVDFTIKCSWSFANTTYKCVGFVADSSNSKKTTPKEYCANELYTNSNGVPSYCSVGKDKTACADYISSSMTSYTSGVGTVSQSVIDGALNTYATGVAEIMTTKNVDPCADTRGTPGYDYCIRGDTNWRYYYESESSKYGTPTIDPDSGNDNEEESTTGGGNSVATVNEGQCTSILPGGWCDNKDGIGSIINMIVSILTGAVVVAGTVGIIICGFLWMTARDNEAQVAMAKRRMLDIVIGIVAWVLLALIANLFIPKTSSDIESDMGYNGNSSKDIKA